MRRLILLRPEPGSSASAERARAMGLTVEQHALFKVVAVPWTVVPDDFDAIVATSANAFRHGGLGLEALRALPVHAVGAATAEAAREAGFAVAQAGEGGADALVLPAGRLLHLTGRDHHAVPGATAVIVYDSVTLKPPPEFDPVDAVIAVHSARAGARLAEIVDQKISTMIAAISPAAAGACGGGWQLVAVAGRPSDAALLALARDLCQKP